MLILPPEKKLQIGQNNPKNQRTLMNLILFGHKSCGKTSIASQLARELQVPFLDTDHCMIESHFQNHGIRCTISELYQHLKEQAFRELEKKVLKRLGPIQKSILAVGGGTVLDPENVHWLSSMGKMVHLKIDPTILKERLSQNIPAFFDRDNTEASFARMMRERDSIYASILAFSIDVTSLHLMEQLKELFYGL